MRPVMRVHGASSADLLAAVAPSRDVQDEHAACGCGRPGACRHAAESAYDALRPRTLDDILEIASRPRRFTASLRPKRNRGQL